MHARHTSSRNCPCTQRQQQCVDGITLVTELIGGGLKITVLTLWGQVLFEKLVDKVNRASRVFYGIWSFLFYSVHYNPTLEPI